MPSAKPVVFQVQVTFFLPFVLRAVVFGFFDASGPLTVTLIFDALRGNEIRQRVPERVPCTVPPAGASTVAFLRIFGAAPALAG